MKKISIILLSTLLILVVGCGKSGQDTATSNDGPVTLETIKQKASYSIGFNIGSSLKDIKNEVDLNLLISGLKDAAKEAKPQMEAEAMKKTIQEFQMALRKSMTEKRKVDGEKNAAEGKKFLEENAKKDGVKVTASGLQYIVLKEGEGNNPKGTEVVRVHYKGTLLDGEEFDSSYKRKEPAKFPLNRVIPGWTEGLQLMKPGAKYKFFIPSALGYKERGTRNIGPNSTLIFEVELLSIEPSAEPKKPAGKPAGKPAPAPKKNDN